MTEHFYETHFSVLKFRNLVMKRNIQKNVHTLEVYTS
jgi:hypothetical protein